MFDSYAVGIVLDLSNSSLKEIQKDIAAGLKKSNYGDRFYLYSNTEEDKIYTSVGKCISLINEHQQMQFVPWQGIAYAQIVVAKELYCNRHVVYLFDDYKYSNKSALLKPLKLNEKMQSGINFHYVYVGKKEMDFSELNGHFCTVYHGEVSAAFNNIFKDSDGYETSN